MNEFMRAGAAARRTLRASLSRGLRAGSADARRCERASWRRRDVEMGLPCRIGDYTDFYTSIHHATSVGTPVPSRQSAAAQLQVGADRLSRARVVDRRESRRRSAGRAASSRAPTTRRRRSVRRGASTTSSRSASSLPAATRRAIRSRSPKRSRTCSALRSSTTGPRATSRRGSTSRSARSCPRTSRPRSRRGSSPLEALAPFRVPFARAEGDPAPLPYLDGAGNRAMGALDLSLEVWISTAAMRAAGLPPQRLMQSNFRDSYWTMAQLVAHHTVNGCNLMPGDLFGSGTQSGPAPGQGGSMLELGVGGKAAAAPCQRRDAKLPRGRRHGDPARLLRARGIAPHRLRRLHGDDRSRDDLGNAAPAHRRGKAWRGVRRCACAGLDDRPGLGALHACGARRLEDAVRATDEAPARPRVRRIRGRHARACRSRPKGFPIFAG